MEHTLQPLVQKVSSLQAQLMRCQAQVDQVVCRSPESLLLPRWLWPGGGRAGSEPSAGRPSETTLAASSESRACLEALVRQLDEGRQSICALQVSTDRLQESLAAMEAQQQTAVDEMRTLRSRVEQLGDAGLELGAPIGKTLNTQDMVAMHAETRTDLNELRNRIDDLCTAMLGGGGNTKHEENRLDQNYSGVVSLYRNEQHNPVMIRTPVRYSL